MTKSSARRNSTAGIDPGISGGISIVTDNGVYVDGIRMPTVVWRQKKIIDARTALAFLRQYAPAQIVIEQNNAMPGQGVSSTFSFGRNTGAIEAVALISGAPIEWVTARVWKGALGLSKSKRASLDACRMKFGEAQLWQVLANDGIAEAALLARYWIDKRS